MPILSLIILGHYEESNFEYVFVVNSVKIITGICLKSK